MSALLPLELDRILTSGGELEALAGAETIKKMVAIVEAGGYSSRTAIVPGGGISPANVLEVVERTGVRMVHASLRSKQQVTEPLALRIATAACAALLTFCLLCRATWSSGKLEYLWAPKNRMSMTRSTRQRWPIGALSKPSQTRCRKFDLSRGQAGTADQTTVEAEYRVPGEACLKRRDSDSSSLLYPIRYTQYFH